MRCKLTKLGYKKQCNKTSHCFLLYEKARFSQQNDSIFNTIWSMDMKLYYSARRPADYNVYILIYIYINEYVYIYINVLFKVHQTVPRD